MLLYLTLKAAEGRLDKVPVFLSLHEWANSGLALMPYIVRQFPESFLSLEIMFLNVFLFWIILFDHLIPERSA